MYFYNRPSLSYGVNWKDWVFVLSVVACAVGLFSYIGYPIKQFGTHHTIPLAIGTISAVTYGVSTVCLKSITTHKTWLYNTGLVKRHWWLGGITRYGAIGAATISIGLLMYYTSIDITTMEYSEQLWNNFRIMAGIAAGIIVAIPWIISKL